MKLIIVAVRDNATEHFNRPILVVHARQALRSFTDEVNTRESEVSKHPEDYELWKLGVWDDQTGEHTNEPERLARAVDLIKE